MGPRMSPCDFRGSFGTREALSKIRLDELGSSSSSGPCLRLDKTPRLGKGTVESGALTYERAIELLAELPSK